MLIFSFGFKFLFGGLELKWFVLGQGDGAKFKFLFGGLEQLFGLLFPRNFSRLNSSLGDWSSLPGKVRKPFFGFKFLFGGLELFLPGRQKREVDAFKFLFGGLERDTVSKF